jgi:hypothetical protein
MPAYVLRVTRILFGTKWEPIADGREVPTTVIIAAAIPNGMSVDFRIV